MKLFVCLLLLFVGGCVFEPEPEPENHFYVKLELSKDSEMTAHNISSTLDRMMLCKPDVFMADNIPTNYRINPNCPPKIIFPSIFIWPNDPGPIIQKFE